MKYELASTEIFEKWLKKLKDHQAKIRIAARLKNVQNGNFGDHEGVGGGVSEVKAIVFIIL